MGKKQEKLCKPKQFKVTERYYWEEKTHWFIVEKIDSEGVYILMDYLRIGGFISFSDKYMDAYHWPISSLEKELI